MWYVCLLFYFLQFQIAKIKSPSNPSPKKQWKEKLNALIL
jgi:hypothetical protein